jgi:chromosome segregation ATPase
MKESYINDLSAVDYQEKSLRNQIAELEGANHAQNELIQQLNTSGEQSKQALATELGILKYKYTKLEAMNAKLETLHAKLEALNTNCEALNTNLHKRLQNEMKYSQNSRNILEQFKRGKR